MNANELTENLAHFTGTEDYHRWSALYSRFFLTDGANYLADQAGAYWLMDVIGAYQGDLLRKGEYFQVWTITVTRPAPDRFGNQQPPFAAIVCDDGNGYVLVRQAVEYTNFPLDEVKLYAQYDGVNLVIMLPSEY